MTIPTTQYLSEEGMLSSSCTQKISDEVLLKAYRAMMTARLVDERMIILQRQGAISFSMSSLGEEACAVASAAALEMGDWMYPQYREVGVMFWRGYPIVNYVHHMFGNASDPLLGRQMPNHFGLRDLNVVPVSSPIATKIPHAAGCGYAMKLQKDPHVAIVYFGEGATSEGDFHCGVNFAAVRRAPTIFFCRNNNYAISTPAWRQFASDGIAPKGVGYGIITYKIDGNDFFAVYEAVAKARQQCIEGKGPVLIEAMTYRRAAHSTSDDPSQYRTDEEVKGWESKDPILRFKRYLMRRELWDEIKEQQLIQQINEEISAAIVTAKATARPPLESLVQDVYFEVPRTLQEQCEEVRALLNEGSHA